MKKRWLKFLKSRFDLRLNCRRTTFLIEKKTETRLSFKEWLEMRLHLWTCSVCREYRKQSHVLHQDMASVFEKQTSVFVPMNPQKKRELERLIQDVLHQKKKNLIKRELNYQSHLRHWSRLPQTFD